MAITLGLMLALGIGLLSLAGEADLQERIARLTASTIIWMR